MLDHLGSRWRRYVSSIEVTQCGHDRRALVREVRKGGEKACLDLQKGRVLSQHRDIVRDVVGRRPRELAGVTGAPGRCCRRAWRWRTGGSDGCGGSLAAGRESGSDG